MGLFKTIDKWWCKNKYGVVYCKSEKLISWLGAVTAVGGISAMLVAMVQDSDVYLGGVIALIGLFFMHWVMLKALRRRTLALMK